MNLVATWGPVLQRRIERDGPLLKGMSDAMGRGYKAMADELTTQAQVLQTVFERKLEEKGFKVQVLNLDWTSDGDAKMDLDLLVPVDMEDAEAQVELENVFGIDLDYEKSGGLHVRPRKWSYQGYVG